MNNSSTIEGEWLPLNQFVESLKGVEARNKATGIKFTIQNIFLKGERIFVSGVSESGMEIPYTGQDQVEILLQ